MGAGWTVLKACNSVAGALDNFCFDLSVVDIPQVACGSDFQALCHDWSHLNGHRLLWSGFFAFVTHFYLVAATGYAAQQRRSIPSLLAQYNLLASLRSERQAPSKEPEAPTVGN